MTARIYKRRLGYSVVLGSLEDLYTERFWRPTLRWARRTADRRYRFHHPGKPGTLIEERHLR